MAKAPRGRTRGAFAFRAASRDAKLRLGGKEEREAMGTLANSIFQVLMGWIRAVALEIWNTFSSPEGTTLMGWVGAHWKGLAIGLCALGLAVDLIVYLFRWQPYRVWRSRRQKRAAEEMEAEAPSGEAEAEIYEMNYDPTEGIPATAAEELAPSLIRQAQEMEAEPAPEAGEAWKGRGEEAGNGLRKKKREGRRSSVARYVENAYEGEAEEEIAAYRREWNPRATAETRAAEPATEPAFRDGMISGAESAGSTTEKFEQAIRPRRRRSVRAMLTDSQDRETETPDQLIDRNEAYRQPVYPRRWTEEEQDNA